jgi:streptogramin lyase
MYRVFCALAILLTPAVASADLLVSSYNQSRVLGYDESTGALHSWSTLFGGSLTGLVVTDDGGVYASSLGNSWIIRYSAGQSAGTLFSVTFINGVLSPVGIVIGPSGDFYIAGAGSHNVGRFDRTTGAFVEMTVPSESGGLRFPTFLTFGPDGDLFVSNSTNQVLRYDGSTGAFKGVFAQGGGLATPEGLRFGPGGDLYVASLWSANVLRYDGTTGAFEGIFAQGGLDRPRDLVFGPNGDLFVSSSGNNRVMRYDGTTGAFKGIFAESDGPNGLAFGPALSSLPDPPEPDRVPEPSSIALALTASLAIALVRRRRRRTTQRVHDRRL